MRTRGCLTDMAGAGGISEICGAAAGICWTASRDLPAGVSASEVTLSDWEEIDLTSAAEAEFLTEGSSCTVG